MDLRSEKTIKARREKIERTLGVSLAHTGTCSLDELVASTRNCENMIGVTQIPLGVAGPLRIQDVTSSAGRQKSESKNDYYLPLATTEGALVASVNRGCKAITESGGAHVSVYRVGATRGPVFKVATSEQNSTLFEFLMAHEADMKEIAKQTSAHLRLVSFDTKHTGLFRFVRFVYNTQDAMGLNMVTIATEEITQFIEKETGVRCVSLSGNFCVDKKAAHLNFQNNRGFEVWADVEIPLAVVRSVLNSTPKKFVETWLAKCMIGSAMSGSMGYNAQFANVLSAIFIATGQDPAHVAECAIGMTTAETTPHGDLFVSIYMPDLMVGTVGGGTGLSTQKEALELLRVAGPSTTGHGEHAETFAGIVGGAVLAGEISLLASLSEGTLAKAHKKFARGEK